MEACKIKLELKVAYFDDENPFARSLLHLATGRVMEGELANAISMRVAANGNLTSVRLLPFDWRVGAEFSFAEVYLEIKPFPHLLATDVVEIVKCCTREISDKHTHIHIGLISVELGPHLYSIADIALPASHSKVA